MTKMSSWRFKETSKDKNKAKLKLAKQKRKQFKMLAKKLKATN